MSAPVLLSEYKMKKKKALEAKRESEAPVTLAFMREFRAEIISRFVEIDVRFKQMDAKFSGRLDAMDAEFSGRLNAIDEKFSNRLDAIDLKIDQAVAEMKTANHQTKLLVEEQNVRNKQVYDGHAIAYGAVQDLQSRIKPECLE